MKKLYIGNLPWSVNDQKLGDLVSKFSSVTSAVVIMDRQTGRSRGFGFVEFSNDEEAMKAIEELNNMDIDGRKLVANEARERDDRPKRF